jgi:hypothetical protein
MGPTFGGGPADLCVADEANANAHSFTCGFGSAYANDSGIEGGALFTGGPYFTVQEIEVLEADGAPRS